MTLWTSTRTIVKQLTKRIDTLVSITTKYLKEIAELKGELRSQRNFFESQMQKRDKDYRELMHMLVKQSMELNVRQVITGQPQRKTSSAADLLSVFDEVPVGDDAGYKADELDIFGYREKVADVKEADDE